MNFDIIFHRLQHDITVEMWDSDNWLSHIQSAHDRADDV